jgi:LysR family transcriptional regulator, nitrogen assimilation regulatory protein
VRSLEIRQLTALVTVADAGSVTAAARLLRVVQPAVTRQIRTLEDEVGVPLFSRTRQGMALTAEGELLVERARRALAELERARLEISPSPGGLTGVVSVGLLESVADVIAPPLASSVAETHPGIELHILSAYSGHLQQWLDAGDIDLSLLYNLSSTQSLAVIPLLREKLWVAAPPDAGLSVQTPVTWTEALERPLVLPIPGHGLRTLIDQALSQLPAPPAMSVQVNSMHLQKRLVLAGQGWTVLPAAGVAGDIAAGTLSGAPLTAPEVERSVVLGLQLGRRTPPSVEAVATELRHLVGELALSGAWPARLEASPQ